MDEEKRDWQWQVGKKVPLFFSVLFHPCKHVRNGCIVLQLLLYKCIQMYSAREKLSDCMSRWAASGVIQGCKTSRDRGKGLPSILERECVCGQLHFIIMLGGLPCSASGPVPCRTLTSSWLSGL